MDAVHMTHHPNYSVIAAEAGKVFSSQCMTDADTTIGAEGYAAGQLARVTATPGAGASVSTARVEGWLAVLASLSSGAYFVGSRAPVLGVPVWATLEVLHGGFASGRLLAELKEGAVPNAWYFTPEGVQRLAQLLDTGEGASGCGVVGAGF